MSDNLNLSDRQEQVLVALLGDLPLSSREGHTALDLARAIGVQGNRRGGNGAVKGSWSGKTSPALAISSTLNGLVRRGLVDRWETQYRGYGKKEYALSTIGRTEAEKLARLLRTEREDDTPS
jgi:hypothetical protein